MNNCNGKLQKIFSIKKSIDENRIKFTFTTECRGGPSSKILLGEFKKIAKKDDFKYDDEQDLYLNIYNYVNVMCNKPKISSCFSFCAMKDAFCQKAK